MSSTTMNMFALRIWGSDFTDAQAQVALSAGWRRADILWENLMVAGNAAWIEGDMRWARKCFRRAALIARFRFERKDLRRATALINLGVLKRHAGKAADARRLFARALSHWDACAEQMIANMQISPRARSSLFHLRMEALHRDTYHENFRIRFGKIACEVRTAIKNLAVDQPRGCRLYSRWIGERPTVFDDTRKVIGACLLIIDHPPASSTESSSKIW